MPATAGRVLMPANNRVHSNAALQTHGIWQSAIGYDPYAPIKDDSESSSNQPHGENAYASFQGLLALARISCSTANETRGACKKCGRVGHFAFQCKNFIILKEKDPESIQAAVVNRLGKFQGEKVNGKKQAESDDDEDSESSDSDADSEIERIIADITDAIAVIVDGASEKGRDGTSNLQPSTSFVLRSSPDCCM